jgi:hypothetical protein
LFSLLKQKLIIGLVKNSAVFTSLFPNVGVDVDTERVIDLSVTASV